MNSEISNQQQPKGLIIVNTGDGKGKSPPLWELFSVRGDTDCVSA